MERICPYLALADDGRTVVDGFDAEHRCHALTPPAPLDRPRQVQLCLTEAHARCERFAAARTASLAASSGLPRVAPDVSFGRTRLILEPEPAWRRASTPRVPLSRRTVVVAGVGATLVAVFVLAGMSGILGGAPLSTASPTPEVSPSTAATPTTSPASPVSPSAAASTSGAPTPTLIPAITPTAAPTQRTYVVQPNDTLGLIAQRFGTTIAAIKAANGLTGDGINIGQVLIIP